MSEQLRAAVVGLGQVGWRFDEEPTRRMVATHVGAYRALDEDFVVAGACDSSVAARDAFAGCHSGVPVFGDVASMMRDAAPDVVSICTPNELHRATLEAVLDSGVPRAIWCEKPLATSLDDGRAMVAACTKAKVPLIVSHVRRWSPLWRRFKAQLDGGDIGKLRCLRVAMPNRLWSIGSHAADLLLWLGGPITAVEALSFAALEENCEPAVGALVAFESGAAGILQVTGRKENLLVEAEAIGDDGRLSLREDRNTVTHETFTRSPRYHFYRELHPDSVEQIVPADGASPFIAVAEEVAGLVRGKIELPTCSGAAALETQTLLERLATARHSPPVTVRA